MIAISTNLKFNLPRIKNPALAGFFLLLLFPLFCFSVEPVEVPKSLPAEQRAALLKERKALVAELKSLNLKLSRHNSQCAKAPPYKEHKCNTERLSLFQAVDKFNNKIADFNKRVAAMDKAANSPAVQEPATAS